LGGCGLGDDVLGCGLGDDVLDCGLGVCGLGDPLCLAGGEPFDLLGYATLESGLLGHVLQKCFDEPHNMHKFLASRISLFISLT
jgi:hypothetical protein